MLPQKILRYLISPPGLPKETFRKISSSTITWNRSISAIPKLLEPDLSDDHEHSSAVRVKNEHTNRARKETPVMKKVGIQPNFYAEKRSLPLSEHSDESDSTSPLHLSYVGSKTIPITSKLHIVNSQEDTPSGVWPVFRMMVGDSNSTRLTPLSQLTLLSPVSIPQDENGIFRESQCESFPNVKGGDLVALRKILMQYHPSLGNEFSQNPLLQSAVNEYPDIATKNTLLRAHRQMIRFREMDKMLESSQRQGRISFYMTSRGEEAIHIGAAAALTLNDIVLAQYREAGVLMWRGFTLEQFTNQCFSNDLDLGKGRQMPVHYGSRALNYHTISSPLGTQLPQAVGAAYHLKLQKKPNVAICFFGDGCASTTDFHSACNFAATLKVPVIFFCRNNGFAISTPIEEQYAGDGIVSRAPGYGMAGIRVDGNDIFAVSAAVKAAKEYALSHSSPVFIEAMTYRQGHHSTSDDSTRYRNVKDVEHVADFGDPIKRLETFLTQIGWVDADSLVAASYEEKNAVLKAISAAERRPKPPLKSLFEDVYHQVPTHLREQEEELHQHIAKYPEIYKMSK